NRLTQIWAELWCFLSFFHSPHKPGHLLVVRDEPWTPAPSPIFNLCLRVGPQRRSESLPARWPKHPEAARSSIFADTITSRRFFSTRVLARAFFFFYEEKTMEQKVLDQIWDNVLHGFRLGVFEDPVAAAKSLCQAHDFLFKSPLPASASPTTEVPLTEAIPAQSAEIAEADLPDTGIKAEDVPEPMPELEPEPEPEFEKMVPPDDEPESNAYDGPDDAEKFSHPEVTKDMVIEAAVKAGARLGRSFVVDQFAAFGANGLPDLDPKHYYQIWKAFSEGEH
ncbi:MAG: hypothetical protein ACI4SY_04645, partial [Sutterella sp.]